MKKTIARSKSVAVYIETTNIETTHSLVCEFDEEGYITIISEFTSGVTIHDINQIFKIAVNPIITEIKKNLEQSGYKLNIFNNVNDENVEIKQLTYETQIKITTNFHLSVRIYAKKSVETKSKAVW